MFVKICGITNEQDALCAVNAGASALGFVFAKSPRYIAPKRAGAIIRKLKYPPPETVGVFVDAGFAEIERIAGIAGLSCIQLHGAESPEFCEQLSSRYRVIKALKVKKDTAMPKIDDFPVWKILLDSWHPALAGGSGVRFDWSILDKFDPQRLIVAGGLNPENVGQLLSRYQPFGIDVSSGVEASPGRKDRRKVEALLYNVVEFF